MMANQTTSPVDGVVATIVKAPSSDGPDARRVVGRDASRLMMLRRFPPGLRDRLLMSTVGLTPEAFVPAGGPFRCPRDFSSTGSAARTRCCCDASRSRACAQRRSRSSV